MSERQVSYSKDFREKAKSVRATMVTLEVDGHYSKKGRVTLQVMLGEKASDEVRDFLFKVMKSAPDSRDTQRRTVKNK